MSASSEAHGSTGGHFPSGDGSTVMRSVLGKKFENVEPLLARPSRHPLPWRNRPANGENHVADANGQPVYDGPDAAEMFRLYGDEAQAEDADRSATERDPESRHRRIRRRRRSRTS
jgi:hypothetical protein